jgi:mono/diheme cytochrome c family protein
MAEVVLGSTQHLTASDLRAMAMFLRSLPPAPTQDTAPPRGEATTAARLTSGAKLYDKHCAACHGEQGEGVKGAYPSLAHNPAVTRPDPTNLVQMVLRGGYAPATVGNPRPFGMPPFVLKLNDRETAEVLSYIRTSWGNPAAQVTELNVTLLRQRQ